MTNVVFAHYTATREQRTELLRTAAYLIEQNGYAPTAVSQLCMEDSRLTLTDAVTFSARRWLNHERAWNDAMFLINARHANQGVTDFSRWCEQQSWLTVANWLVQLADMVHDGMREAQA